MTNYSGPERRGYDKYLDDISAKLSNLEIDVKILVNKLENLHTSVNKSQQQFQVEIEKHDKTLYGNGVVGLTSKVESAMQGWTGFKKNFDDHIVSDRWMFGVTVSLLVSILGKLVFFN